MNGLIKCIDNTSCAKGELPEMAAIDLTLVLLFLCWFLTMQTTQIRFAVRTLCTLLLSKQFIELAGFTSGRKLPDHTTKLLINTLPSRGSC